MSPSDSRVRTEPTSLTRVAERSGITALTWALFEETCVDAVVTTRDGGVSQGPYRSLNLALHVGDEESAVLENRRRAVRALGADIGDLVVADQVHGAHVTVVGAAEAGHGALSVADAVAETDALVTTDPGLVVAILVADCAPVILFDPVARVLGCAHAGWRGTLGGVIEATVDAMSARGADPRSMLAGIGPVIGAGRFEVGPEVVAAATDQLGERNLCAPSGRPDHWRFDLFGAIRSLLVRAGLEAGRISSTAIDTGPPGPFFSARAEGRCGRFALLARIQP